MKERFHFADDFMNRHIGPTPAETESMLKAVKADSLEQLLQETLPQQIRLQKDFDLPERMNEYRYSKHIRQVANKNKVFRSYIGMGYYNTITPAPIQRNIFENPGWYTQYTPYQAEIAQGRLEALLNFQTMVSDLTGLEIANASLLDEATAAAEAMSMFYSKTNRKLQEPKRAKFFIDKGVLPQTIDVIKTRSNPFPIELVIGDFKDAQLDDNYFAALVQYPTADGAVHDYRAFIEQAKSHGIFTIMAADILSLALLTSPGELGADVAVGSTQRFGIPLGFGGPHAAYFACHEDFKRLIPGRIIGVSIDANERSAFRMALQTREQHIRREKATSNICTAQALLAIMAGMYAVYHGPEGIKAIAERVHFMTQTLEKELAALGFTATHQQFFDTLRIAGNGKTDTIRQAAEAKEINFFYHDNGDIGIALDETVSTEDLEDILAVFAQSKAKHIDFSQYYDLETALPATLKRTSAYLEHPIFNLFRSETDLMRYIKRLENRDLSLTHSMIPLGSCTMKLNAASELMPVSWPEFGQIHPFVPKSQVPGYYQMIEELEAYLSSITGFSACSLQPNSGAQGEFTGLLVIRAYHLDRGDKHRKVALIPSSAHGTNPASAVMAGMDVVVVACDDQGNIDVADLKAKAEQYKDTLSALMVTYPSTHGVFEEAIQEICDIIHANGGLVYMDGANMNAQVGYTSPANIGADVCHLNLHKTFSIPHGGGGPGMGPICVNDKLKPYLPGHVLVPTGGEKATTAVSAIPFGSASILLISYAYIRMLGKEGAARSTAMAILNANYLKEMIAPYYPVLYMGKNNRVGHEFIIDLRGFKNDYDIEIDDVAKRLMDYGFHAPTMSFPVPGTMMIEPTESESKGELDRFIEAMVQIRQEIQDVIDGKIAIEDSPLRHAPHTAEVVMADDWNRKYTRKQAAYPIPYLKEGKFWPAVGRINNPYGDRNLICTCPPMEEYHADQMVTTETIEL